MLYKILHNKISIPLGHYRAPLTIFTRGHTQRIHQVSANINAYLHSFFPSSIKLWNNLSQEIIQALSVEEFKRLVTNYYPGNYRPVSLTCICSKLLEHIVYSHIFSHITKYNILTEEQHGFRQYRSCETQLIATANDLAENLNCGNQTDVILLDFTKAFDKVPHGRLCSKLYHLGIKGPLLSWIESFLAARQQKVVVNGETSSLSPVTSGVPQGMVLAPLLFLCYINDITKDISSKIKLYADDVLIYNIINSEEDCIKLQNDLNTLNAWAVTWKMYFNPTKCEFLRVTNKKNIIKFQYFIQNNIIQEVQQAKYLGVTFNNKLSWSNHIKIICSKANSVVGFLRRNFYQCPTKNKKCTVFEF